MRWVVGRYGKRGFSSQFSALSTMHRPPGWLNGRVWINYVEDADLELDRPLMLCDLNHIFGRLPIPVH